MAGVKRIVKSRDGIIFPASCLKRQEFFIFIAAHFDRKIVAFRHGDKPPLAIIYKNLWKGGVKK